ncbi:MAG: hypothetical protein ABI689_13020 [Thermoanaerobaculia bacterium]
MRPRLTWKLAPAALAWALVAGDGSAILAAEAPCLVCPGVTVEDPFAIAAALDTPPRLEKGARLFVAWNAALDGSASPAGAHRIAATGAQPWIRLQFSTPAPLLEHVEAMQREIDAAVELARLAPATTSYEVVWGGDGADPVDARQYAFLVKRAAVALTGVQPESRIFAQPLPTDAEWIDLWYGEGVAAYVDGVALLPSGVETTAALAQIAGLDPGKPLVLEALALPGNPRSAVARLAEQAAAGFAITFFQATGPSFPLALTAADLAPLKVMANEFRGELQADTGTVPAGATAAWSFVRGEDLGLRVVVASTVPPPATGATPAAAAKPLVLTFPDPQLKTPLRIDLTTGAATAMAEPRRSATSSELRLTKPDAVELLRLARPSAAELEGVTEEVTVASERDVPVEEILRRLQAFEDSQARRLLRYQAVNATTLRFQAASGTQAIEATFEGEFFFRQGQPFDWAWKNFYVNGVRWRGKEIPELPLIQPEKAAAMPLEILFTKEYRYSLRGRETVEGRDCWVVDFAPAVPVEGKNLYRGTVWVDRALWARVRSRAVQLGLQGEVLSNEETMSYLPIDENGAPAPWSATSYFLPLKVTAQQVLSVLNTATVVEKQVQLTGIRINGPDFDQRRDEVLASSSTMVRDTDKGFRYLVKDEKTGERALKEGFDSDRLFLLGGTFYDDSLDYPLPLIGLNYFNLDVGGKKRQLNAFFGGVLGILNYADPRVGGSRFDLGVDVFGIAIASSDQLYRDGVEIPDEEVKELPARVSVNVGHPLGNFVKWNASYQLSWSSFSDTDKTAADFVVPESTFTHSLATALAYSRSGYRLELTGAFHQRAKWDFWGPPGAAESGDFDPAAKDYLTWQVAASKNWYLANFRKVGLSFEYLGGSDLDRFSKYQFGFFGGTRVHGYQIGKVRAEEAYAAHASYGFELGTLLRLDAVVDAAWATDKASGLDNELLSGVGVTGTFMGPWETIINMDIGTPVAGPDDGVVAYIVFLKLFN